MLNNFENSPIQCHRCKNTFTVEDLKLVLLTHGFFILSANNDEMIYSNCPDPICHAPLLVSKGADGTIDNFFHVLCDIIFPHSTSDVGLSEMDFRNHSSLQSKIKDSLALAMKGVDIVQYPLEITDNTEDAINSYVNDNPWLEDYYCSIHHNYMRYMSTPISVWWLSKKQISSLISIEQKQKLRIFPRYLPYDPLFGQIDTFVWEYHLAKIFYSRLNLPLPLPKLTASNSKNLITKNFQFLNLLETVPKIAQQITEEAGLSRGAYTISNPYNIKLPRVFMGVNLFDFEPANKLSLHVDEIWNNFHEESSQKQLSLMSENFFRDYLALYSNIDFGLPRVWNLLTLYFKELVDSITSQKKRTFILKKNKNNSLERTKKEFPEFDAIISDHLHLDSIKSELGQLAQSNKSALTFLLLGEPGTGKKLFAKAIHKASGRTGEFHSVNCTTLTDSVFAREMFGHMKGAFTGADKDTKGFFESANNGTLVIDEIGDLDFSLQVKLLTVVEDKYLYPVGSSNPVNVDVSLIFATNQNLLKKIEKGTFRQDLYGRIKGLEYKIPPLRDRKGDIKILVHHFIPKHAKITGKEKLVSVRCSDEGIQFLSSLKWPDNVRELEQQIEKIILLRDKDDLQDISLEEINLRVDKELLKGLDSSSKKHKEKKKKQSPTIEEYDRLLKEGMTKVAIAKMFNYDRSALHRAMKKKKEDVTKSI